MKLDQHNFKIGAICAAIVAVVGILAIAIGSNVSSIAADRTGTAGLVACAQTGMSAVDCRVLIYGSR